jgi:glutathione synthase/RimK-type ligase-like ATP-grasp enzyme
MKTGGQMKLAILSRNTKLYSTQRLVAAARERGHIVRVLDPLRCYMKIAPGTFNLNYKGRPLGGIDAVIPRIGASVTRYGTAVLRQLEMMGAYTPNSSDAILRARDKLRCHQLLAGQGIGLPTTVFGDNPDDTDDLLRLLGKPPHVIKLIEGSQGNGVVLAERLSSSRSVIEAFRGLYANFLVQEFIGEAAAPTSAASWSASAWSRRCIARPRRASSAPTCTGAARPAGSVSRLLRKGQPCAPRRSWDCRSPASICCDLAPVRWYLR